MCEREKERDRKGQRWMERKIEGKVREGQKERVGEEKTRGDGEGEILGIDRRYIDKTQ